MNDTRTESQTFRNFKICLMWSATTSSNVWKWMEMQLLPWKDFTIRDVTIYHPAATFTRTSRPHGVLFKIIFTIIII